MKTFEKPISLGSADNVMDLLGLSLEARKPGTSAVRYASTSGNRAVSSKNVSLRRHENENYSSVLCQIAFPVWLTAALLDAVAVLQIHLHQGGSIQTQTTMMWVSMVRDPEPPLEDDGEVLIELDFLKSNNGLLSLFPSVDRHSWNAKLTQYLTHEGLRAVIGISLDMQMPN
jgi:hypothetical protein